MILNLKTFNQYVPYKHFKMEHFETVLNLISPNDFMGSYDISDAYYSVSISEEDQRYFSFKWRNTYYSFKVLPQGWSSSPYIFTKLMKPVFSYLRSKGHINSYFLDDSFLLGATKEDCAQNISDTGNVLDWLGFILNLKKSIREPTQIMQHLGNIINTVDMLVYLPEEKKEKIIHLCKNLKNKRRTTIREVATVIGVLVASFQAVTFGRLFYRELEAAKIASLKHSKGNYDASIKITDAMKNDLNYWIKNIHQEVRKIRIPPPDITIQTDSSTEGWACVFGEKTAHGRWAEWEAQYHINVLEIRAILLGIASFRDDFASKHIKVLSDSTTAVTYINNMGGTKSPNCNQAAKETWLLCKKFNIWLTCAHIPGIYNEADLPSIKFKDDIEWSLDKQVFKNICSVWGRPEIDLFANRLNNQIATFCSWFPDPDASYINAFTIQWSDFNLSYMFPPYSMIGRCLKKLNDERAEAILIAPIWPSQPWFPKLLGTLVDAPRILPRTDELLSLPHKARKTHPLADTMKMMACRVSGCSFKAKAFRMKQPKSSWRHGELPQGRNTTYTSDDGRCFVTNGRLINFRYL